MNEEEITYWQKKLLEINGVTLELLEKAQVKVEDYPRLYRKLSFIPELFSSEAHIVTLPYIYAILGNLNELKQADLSLWENDISLAQYLYLSENSLDNRNACEVFQIAYSLDLADQDKNLGYLEMLAFQYATVAQKNPLPSITDYAATSGDLHTLSWIYNNHCSFFSKTIEQSWAIGMQRFEINANVPPGIVIQFIKEIFQNLELLKNDSLFAETALAKKIKSDLQLKLTDFSKLVEQHIENEEWVKIIELLTKIRPIESLKVIVNYFSPLMSLLAQRLANQIVEIPGLNEQQKFDLILQLLNTKASLERKDLKTLSIISQRGLDSTLYKKFSNLKDILENNPIQKEIFWIKKLTTLGINENLLTHLNADNCLFLYRKLNDLSTIYPLQDKKKKITLSQWKVYAILGEVSSALTQMQQEKNYKSSKFINQFYQYLLLSGEQEAFNFIKTHLVEFASALKGNEIYFANMAVISGNIELFKWLASEYPSINQKISKISLVNAATASGNVAMLLYVCEIERVLHFNAPWSTSKNKLILNDFFPVKSMNMYIKEKINNNNAINNKKHAFSLQLIIENKTELENDFKLFTTRVENYIKKEKWTKAIESLDGVESSFPELTQKLAEKLSEPTTKIPDLEEPEKLKHVLHLLANQSRLNMGDNEIITDILKQYQKYLTSSNIEDNRPLIQSGPEQLLSERAQDYHFVCTTEVITAIEKIILIKKNYIHWIQDYNLKNWHNFIFSTQLEPNQIKYLEQLLKLINQNPRFLSRILLNDEIKNKIAVNNNQQILFPLEMLAHDPSAMLKSIDPSLYHKYIPFDMYEDARYELALKTMLSFEERTELKWLDKMTVLGVVSPRIVTQANLDLADFPRVYELLETISSSHGWSSTFRLTHPAQLWALLGKIEKAAAFEAKLTNSWSMTLADYAFFSGNIPAVEWVKKNRPAQLLQENSQGWNGIVYAILSGNPKMLDYITQHLPDLWVPYEQQDRQLGPEILLSNQDPRIILAWLAENKPALYPKNLKKWRIPTHVESSIVRELKENKVNFKLKDMLAKQEAAQDVSLVEQFIYMINHENIDSFSKTLSDFFAKHDVKTAIRVLKTKINGETLLHAACKNRDNAFLLAFLNFGGMIASNIQNDLGKLPLEGVAGSYPALQVLLQRRLEQFNAWYSIAEAYLALRTDSSWETLDDNQKKTLIILSDQLDSLGMNRFPFVGLFAKLHEIIQEDKANFEKNLWDKIIHNDFDQCYPLVEGVEHLFPLITKMIRNTFITNEKNLKKIMQLYNFELSLSEHDYEQLSAALGVNLNSVFILTRTHLLTQIDLLIKEYKDALDKMNNIIDARLVAQQDFLIQLKIKIQNNPSVIQKALSIREIKNSLRFSLPRENSLIILNDLLENPKNIVNLKIDLNNAEKPLSLQEINQANFQEQLNSLLNADIISPIKYCFKQAIKGYLKNIDHQSEREKYIKDIDAVAVVFREGTTAQKHEFCSHYPDKAALFHAAFEWKQLKDSDTQAFQLRPGLHACLEKTLLKEYCIFFYMLNHLIKLKELNDPMYTQRLERFKNIINGLETTSINLNQALKKESWIDSKKVYLENDDPFRFVKSLQDDSEKIKQLRNSYEVFKQYNHSEEMNSIIDELFSFIQPQLVTISTEYSINNDF